MKPFFVLFFLPFAAIAGTNSLTGNLRVDLLSLSAADSLPQTQTVMVQNSVDHSKFKSPLLAAGMSMVLPGAGEFYSDRFLKSGIFLAIEVATVATAIVYNNKGNNKTAEFQNYADQHWSAVDYATWIQVNGAKYEVSGETYPAITPEVLKAVASYDFSVINIWEAANHTEGFSHLLPPHGEQQYYELIGKYSQFKYGWDTYVGKDGTRYGDDGYDVSYIPQQMTDYAHNRGKANDYYYTAGVAAALIVANHVISALDAAWSTSHYNKEVTSEMGVHLQNMGGGELAVVTQLTVKVKL